MQVLSVNSIRDNFFDFFSSDLTLFKVSSLTSDTDAWGGKGWLAENIMFLFVLNNLSFSLLILFSGLVFIESDRLCLFKVVSLLPSACFLFLRFLGLMDAFSMFVETETTRVLGARGALAAPGYRFVLIRSLGIAPIRCRGV